MDVNENDVDRLTHLTNIEAIDTPVRAGILVRVNNLGQTNVK